MSSCHGWNAALSCSQQCEQVLQRVAEVLLQHEYADVDEDQRRVAVGMLANMRGYYRCQIRRCRNTRSSQRPNL